MTNTPPPRLPGDASLKLRRELYYFLAATLTGMLPTPPNEAADQVRRRYRVAIAQVAGLRPANHDEALIAARYVAAGAHADEAMRLATYHADNPPLVAQLQRQAASMMRESRGFRTLLSRVQAERHKRYPSANTAEQDARTAYVALEIMTQALDELAPEPQRAPPPPARPVAAPRSVPGQRRRSDAETLRPLVSVTGTDGVLSPDAIVRTQAPDGEAFVRESELAAAD